MDVRHQCRNMNGQWVQFQTPWGRHRGIIERTSEHGVLMRVPRQYAPVGYASASLDDEAKIDLALQQVAWGNPGYAYGAGQGYGAGQPPYGGGYGSPYGGAYGRPGYGRWAGGWLWWWLAFAWIFALAFLW